MNILAIETSTEACSAALDIDDSCISRHEIAPRKHTELILPMVDSLLQEAGIGVNSLDAIAFGCGPGAFTGIRIAVGITQGLAYPYDIPVIPVSTLAALAQQYSKEYDHIAAAIDARMKEIYWGLYKVNEYNLVETIKKEKVCLPKNISSPTNGNWLGAGTGWKNYSEEIKSQFKSKIIDIKNDAYPHAKNVIQLAKPSYINGKFISADLASPVYLRNKIVS
tara:strand:+ start:52 stop:717 length:666 start_codon:yes stop_codon:yes gene_type:complete